MKRGVVKFTILAAILSFTAFPAFGWDDTGHKITAYIAWQRMTPEVREKIISILRAAPEDAQISTFYLPYGSRSDEAKKREFFMLMATWADIIRDTKFETRNKKYHKSNWHYYDNFWQWKDGKVVTVETNEPGGQAIPKIAEFDQLIRSSTATDADKAVAIAWLEHLIGDIHQPLHAAARVTDSNPKGDQGGNLFLLTPRGTTRDKQENLHWFWDSIVVRYMPNSKDLCEADYLDPIAASIMTKYPYEKLKDKLSVDNYDAWQKESFQIATTTVYKDLKWFEAPSDKYKKRAFEIAEERLALAGYRMGELFNKAFTMAPITTPASPTQY
jgi:hypothetical protein